MQDKLISTFARQNLKVLTQALMGSSHVHSPEGQDNTFSLMSASLWQLPAQRRHSECTLQGQGRASQEHCSGPVLRSTMSRLLSVTSSNIIYHKLFAPHTPHTCFIAGFLSPPKNRRRAHEFGISQPWRRCQIAYYEFWLLELSYHRGRNK